VASRIDAYDPHFKFFSWIYRIAVNESLNLLRRQGREEGLEDDEQVLAAESADPAWQVSEAQTSRRIRDAVLSMTTNDRMGIALRHFSECGYQEIAHILEIDEKTVKSRLFEARQRLRELLHDLRQEALFAVIGLTLLEERGDRSRSLALLPGFVLARILHSSYNHLFSRRSSRRSRC